MFDNVGLNMFEKVREGSRRFEQSTIRMFQDVHFIPTDPERGIAAFWHNFMCASDIFPLPVGKCPLFQVLVISFT